MELLERDAFLEVLDGYLSEADGGTGRAVLVSGEAGIGKTTLVDSFVQRHRGSNRVLWGACDGLFTPRALGPLIDIASDVGAGLTDLLHGRDTRDEIFRTLLSDLSASGRTTILVVEDVHWADEATLDLLRFLGRRLSATRMLLIVTYRDDEIGEAHPLRVVIGDLSTLGAVRRIKLPPLSRQAVEYMVGDHGIDVEALLRQTGGNPFFVSEVLSFGELGIPETIRDACSHALLASPLPPGRFWTRQRLSAPASKWTCFPR